MGFEKNQLIESLLCRVQNEGTVAYYLFMDSRFRSTGGYLGAQFEGKMESGFSKMDTGDIPTNAVANHITGYVDHQGMGMRPQLAIDTKWALGLQFQAHPREIMLEVLKALQKLNVCWKKIGHYNMKCRWVPGFADHSHGTLKDPMNINQHFGVESSVVVSDDATGNSTNVVKFEVQVSLHL